ncbi:MAG: hypothetical protein OEV42_17585, partial [Deltaproteobacteria bacterium]|nr:hypothetical protein [Deltaproteobacteria bacterium]
SSMEGEYHVKVKSNIDRVVKKAIGKRVEKESRRFAKELKREIAKKVSKPLDALKKAGGGLGDLDKILEGNLKDLESQLKSSKKLSSKGLKFKF